MLPPEVLYALMDAIKVGLASVTAGANQSTRGLNEITEAVKRIGEQYDG